MGNHQATGPKPATTYLTEWVNAKVKFWYFYIANFEQVALGKYTLTGISFSTYDGQIQGENLKRIFANHHILFDGFSVIHNTYNHIWLYYKTTGSHSELF